MRVQRVQGQPVQGIKHLLQEGATRANYLQAWLSEGLQFSTLAYFPVSPLYQEVPEAEKLVLGEVQVKCDCVYLDA